MITLTIQKAPDGVWIVDLIVSGDKRVSKFMQQSWTTEPCESSEQAYSALVRSALPQLLMNEKLLEYARTA